MNRNESQEENLALAIEGLAGGKLMPREVFGLHQDEIISMLCHLNKCERAAEKDDRPTECWRSALAWVVKQSISRMPSHLLQSCQNLLYVLHSSCLNTRTWVRDSPVCRMPTREDPGTGFISQC